MPSILIVEDERPINDLIRKNLTLTGNACTQAASVADALAALGGTHFDLALVDIMLPDGEGFAVLESKPDLPVIFVTARGAVPDKVRGLTMGAYDYIVKPFAVAELLARVQNVLRRTKKLPFSIGELTIDFDARQVTLSGSPVELTPQEYALFETLVLNRNIALSRDRLLTMAWGMDYFGDSRTVDVHVQKLRKKLCLEERLRTVYKVGYRLEA